MTIGTVKLSGDGWVFDMDELGAETSRVFRTEGEAIRAAAKFIDAIKEKGIAAQAAVEAERNAKSPDQEPPTEPKGPSAGSRAAFAARNGGMGY